jgi:hypothetical protein
LAPKKVEAGRYPFSPAVAGQTADLQVARADCPTSMISYNINISFQQIAAVCVRIAISSHNAQRVSASAFV